MSKAIRSDRWQHSEKHSASLMRACAPLTTARCARPLCAEAAHARRAPRAHHERDLGTHRPTPGSCSSLFSMSLVAFAATLGALRAPPPRMNFFDSVKSLVGGAASPSFTPSADFESKAPAWAELQATLAASSTEEELKFRDELESGRAERACALATKRLFDLPDGEEPRVTLYRDTAAWCPCARPAPHPLTAWPSSLTGSGLLVRRCGGAPCGRLREGVAHARDEARALRH